MLRGTEGGGQRALGPGFGKQDTAVWLPAEGSGRRPGSGEKEVSGGAWWVQVPGKLSGGVPGDWIVSSHSAVQKGGPGQRGTEKRGLPASAFLTAARQIWSQKFPRHWARIPENCPSLPTPL